MNAICRACMTENGPMESLFNCYEAHPVTFTLCEIFTSCTALQVKKDDGLPEQLCAECIAQLTQWFTFRETSVKSDENLRDILSKTKHVVGELENVNVLNEDFDLNVKMEEIEEDQTETSPVYILVVNDETEKETECNKICVNDKLIKNENPGGQEEKIDALMVMQKENDEENLRSVTKDHAYYSDNNKAKHKLSKNYYHCRWCLEIFTNLKKYNSHVSKEHGTIPECKKCNKSFQSQDRLSQHKCHDNDEALKGPAPRRISGKDPIKCSFCGKTFKSLWRLKTHLLVHTGERPHMCHVCGKTFSQKPHLKTHYFTHSGIKNYICETCGKKFATVSFLKNHMRHHDDKTKRHACGECSKTFYLPSELKAHMTTHTGERPFKCAICSKSFRLKAAMKTHQFRHGSCELRDVGRPFWCNVCNRTFTKEIFLENHLESVHSGEDKKTSFCCKVCGREFRTKNTLKMHSIRHTSNRPYLCTICNRNFKEEVNLIAHIKFHARPKPFECETCHKRFIDRCALRVHNRTHTGERPFACELCEKRFTVKRSLEAHMRCHTGERPFACSICKNTFTQRCSLQTHMLLIHNCDP